MRITTALTTIRRTIAYFISPPVHATTAWEPSRQLALPAPPQTTGEMEMPVYGARPWPGPTGTWTSVYRKEQPHRRRDSGVLIPPRHTDGLRPLRPVRLTPIPETMEVDPRVATMPTWYGFDEAPDTDPWHTPFVPSGPLPAWLTDEPPVLVPLPTQSLSVADRTAISTLFEDMSESDCVEIDDSDLTEQRAAVDGRKRIEEIIQQMRESE